MLKEQRRIQKSGWGGGIEDFLREGGKFIFPQEFPPAQNAQNLKNK